MEKIRSSVIIRLLVSVVALVVCGLAALALLLCAVFTIASFFDGPPSGPMVLPASFLAKICGFVFIITVTPGLFLILMAKNFRPKPRPGAG